ncbi:calcium-binding protein, partial [Paracoccus sp. UBA5162]
GGNGNDSLVGGGGRDTIYGGAGNDRIRSSGQGVYDGQGGNDYIYAASGTPETLRGGAGVDWLNTRHWSGDYTIDMVTGATNYAGESFTQFENLVTGAGDDRITGTADANRIYTYDGN